MTNLIHPTAIIDPTAELGRNVSVGPYTIIEGDVEIGDDCEIAPHVLIAAGTRMGRRNKIFKGASIGAVPQDLKFGNEKTIFRMGDDNTIREFCTLNRGTVATGETRLGNNCLLMAYCHLGHDCHIGNNFVAANLVNLAGHVTVGDYVGVGGMVAIVQFRTIGDYAFIGAFMSVVKDIPPYALTAANPSRIVSINKVGLERRGFDESRRRAIKNAYKILFRENLLFADALAKITATYPVNDDIRKLVEFAQKSERGLLRMGSSEE